MTGLYGDRYDSRKALADGNYHSNIRVCIYVEIWKYLYICRHICRYLDMYIYM
jgi:hypothetical protein